jgi:hypothetical protein
MEVGVAGVDVEELVEMGEHRHDGESPLVTRSTLEQVGRFSFFITLYPSTNCDKLSGLFNPSPVLSPLLFKTLNVGEYGPS